MLFQHQPQQWFSACLLFCLLSTSAIQVANKEQFKQQVCSNFASGKHFIIGLGFIADAFVLLTMANQMAEVLEAKHVRPFDLNKIFNVTVLHEDISSWNKIIAMVTSDDKNTKNFLVGQHASSKQDVSVLELEDSQASPSRHSLYNAMKVDLGRVWLSSMELKTFYALTDQTIAKLNLSNLASSPPNPIDISSVSPPVWICQVNDTHLTLHRRKSCTTGWTVLKQVITGFVITVDLQYEVHLLTNNFAYNFSFIDFEKDTRDSVTVNFSSISCEKYFACPTVHTKVMFSIGPNSGSTKPSGRLPSVIIPVVIVLVVIIAVALTYFYGGSFGKSKKKKKKSAGSNDQRKLSAISSKRLPSASHVNKLISSTKINQEKPQSALCQGKLSMKLKSPPPCMVKAPTMMDSNFGKLNSKFIIDVDVSVPNSTDITPSQFERQFSMQHPKLKEAKSSPAVNEVKRNDIHHSVGKMSKGALTKRSTSRLKRPNSSSKQKHGSGVKVLSKK